MSHERHGSLHLRVKKQRERELKIVKEWNVKLDRQTGNRQTVRQTNKQLDGLPVWKMHNTDFIMIIKKFHRDLHFTDSKTNTQTDG